LRKLRLLLSFILMSATPAIAGEYIFGDLKVTDNATISGRMDVAESVSVTDSVDTPIVFNSTDDLKIQPNVGIGDHVTMFEDTVVAGGEQGNALRIYRNADRIFFYINSTPTAMFQSTLNMSFMAAAGKYIYLKSGDSIYNNLGDNAGVDDWVLRDSGSAILANIDSNGNMDLVGDMTVGQSLSVSGAISSATLAITTANDGDSIDVSGVNTLFVDGTGGDITISGFVNGVNGQYLAVVRINTTNDMLVEHDNSAQQDIMLHVGANVTITDFGGFYLVCNGTDWFDVSHAKHVP